MAVWGTRVLFCQSRFGREMDPGFQSETDTREFQGADWRGPWLWHFDVTAATVVLLEFLIWVTLINIAGHFNIPTAVFLHQAHSSPNDFKVCIQTQLSCADIYSEKVKDEKKKKKKKEEKRKKHFLRTFKHRDVLSILSIFNLFNISLKYCLTYCFIFIFKFWALFSWSKHRFQIIKSVWFINHSNITERKIRKDISLNIIKSIFRILLHRDKR